MSQLSILLQNCRVNVLNSALSDSKNAHFKRSKLTGKRLKFDLFDKFSWEIHLKFDLFDKVNWQIPLNLTYLRYIKSENHLDLRIQ